MNSHSSHHDDFYELMASQKLVEVPAFLEENIMRKIEKSNVPLSSTFKLRSIFIFGIMSSLYVLLSLWIGYYYPHSTILYDIKNILLGGIFVHIIYEANEILPTLIERNWLNHKHSIIN
jgi:zinc transporter ZupT